ncbi:accessory factor UbiK family protein [Thiomicrorhabdus lithotrophica]|uniref:Ubiquinone biosynthesis accessory factor UbiK n=1 Tax=Thiomicrorhabdus lithotrophica TaxID=2949997 RepID=A0ABY8CFL7_9GAMM|nr:accessory factor UbiK family protein [Thiomicrorhabdus lithotrophica]WEJ62913.1 accessory factor UbiK family protein [Thiomicrorhabdus lithotrophica]
MLNPSQLESVAKKIAEIIPEGFGEMPAGMQSQVKTVLASAFDKMELVTREEFDIQSGVLAKTRSKLEQLEKQVVELEQLLKDK